MTCTHLQQEVVMYSKTANQNCVLCRKNLYRWNLRTGTDLAPIEDQALSKDEMDQESI